MTTMQMVGFSISDHYYLDALILLVNLDFAEYHDFRETLQGDSSAIYLDSHFYPVNLTYDPLMHM